MLSSLLLVLIAFVLSTALVLAALRTLPITLDELPQTVHDIVALSRALRDYSRSDYAAALHVMAVLSLTAVWKHAWSIPGSVIWASLLFIHFILFCLNMFRMLLVELCSLRCLQHFY